MSILETRAFIVHGSDLAAAAILRRALREMGLRVDEFEEHANRLGPLPVVSEIVRKGIDDAHVVVVLFTPDEHAARLDPSNGLLDSSYQGARWQARPNVIFEAGWAFGKKPGSTVFVTLGTETSLFSDVAGLHAVKLEQPNALETLRARLTAIIGPLPLEAPSPETVAELARAVRQRWDVYDEIRVLRGMLDNVDIYKTAKDRRNKSANRVRLRKVIEDAITQHPDWTWEKRSPHDLIGELAQQGDKFADQAYWELVRCGFLQFRNIDEDWGEHWRDSIARTEFAPRARAFIHWVKSR